MSFGIKELIVILVIVMLVFGTKMTKSCFYRTYDEGRWVVTDEVIKDPADIYGVAP